MKLSEVREATDDFVVTWADEIEAATYWAFDQSHAPQPLTPVAQDLVTLWYERALGLPVCIVNGYLFTADDEETLPALPAEFAGRAALDLWQSVFEPRIRARLGRLRQLDMGAPAAEVVAHVLDESAEAFRDSMYTLPLVFRPAERLLAFCERHLRDAAQVGGALLRGFDNLTTARETALARLAELAPGDASIAAALAEGRVPESPDAARFRGELDEFLTRFGRQAASWFDMETPTWEEEPAVVYRLILARLRDGSASSARPDAAARAAALDEAAARLPNAELRTELRSLAADAANFVRVREDRAYWQLETSGCVRAALLRVGAALVAEGRLTLPDDVLYLYTHELGGESGRWPSLVEQRRARLAHWATLLPPESVGGPSRRASAAPSPAPSPAAPPADDARVLRGTAASAGVVTGVARVIRGPEEADRLGRGEIVVCRTTVPAWSPLLAIAGGVVANSGSVLGHTAILARELGIPCVIAATGATTLIQDGDLLRVDGGAGEIRILDAEAAPQR